MNENQDTLEEIQVGRIVHFVIPSGKCRPGLVVEAWENSGKPGYCNLVVFPDGSNDSKYGIDDHTHRMLNVPITVDYSARTGSANLSLLSRWETSVLPNHAVRAVRTWHWGRECNKLRQPSTPFIDENEEIHHHNHADGMTDPHNCQGCRAQARYIKDNIP